MNFFKKSNFFILNWTMEALNQDVDNDPLRPKIDFAVGGQAVIEGVMMRSPNNISIAVRKLDGTIKVKKRPYHTLTQRFKWLNIPILRGVVNLFEMMAVGSNAINYSANESLEELDDDGNIKLSSARVKDGNTSKSSNSSSAKSVKKSSVKSSVMSKTASIIMFTLSFVLAIALSIGLFKFIPLWITTWLESKSSYIENNYIIFNLIDGLLKMSFFLTYIYILTLFPNFRRIFQYHGAEHKSIFNYEAHEELNVKNAKKQIRFHPRCGTSFILIVFVISILFYTFIPQQPGFLMNFSLRLALLPFVAGISYEYLKLSAKYAKHPIVKAMIAPGLWFQRLTTKEPDDKQLEVGLKSLQTALAMEKK